MGKMYNENGVAFAPWALRTIDEDALIDRALAEERGIPLPKKVKTSSLDRGEVEGAEGMRWRMAGNQVELAWRTNGEENNLGYTVQKRPSYGGDFQEVASFLDVSSLKSKGAAGGRYNFIDPSTSSGSWIYRVLDCDATDTKNTLCQCFVEVQSQSEANTQGVITAGFVLFAVAAVAAGLAFDPKM